MKTFYVQYFLHFPFHSLPIKMASSTSPTRLKNAWDDQKGCDLGDCILSIFSSRQIYVFMYVQKDKYVFTRLPQGNRFFQKNWLKQMERFFEQ